MDKLQAMSVFVRIAEQGSLTAAANSLEKSLPAVVRMLAALENNLQIRLFNRTTRKIALTEEGRIYLERCRKILAEIDEAERLLLNDQADPSGTITITAPVRFGQMHVAPAINRLINQYPRIQVNLLLLDRIVNMLDEGIDLAVRIAPLGDSTLIAKSVGEIRQVVCASPDILKQYGMPDHPDALSQLPCVRFTGISAGSIWQFQEGSKKISIQVGGSLLCNHVAASVDACVAGIGFGYFYSYQIMPYVKQGKLKMVLQDFELAPQPVSLVYQHRQLMSSTIRIFVDSLAFHLKDSLDHSAK
ncbi:Transcriptional regulator, LysR family [hydrothermal vent metagenome]|uniref:Transcriptional regulator, LysR family n=1 Tax=hydrothermal vent metagenome TaxID=652676 RepID=A0A3B0ZGA1_9ZZZZ